MESSSSDAHSDRHGGKNRFKFASFPDYVRKVQQLSFSQAVTVNSSGEGKTLPSGIKKQNLSRALSCFTTSSNSPNLPCKTTDAVKQPRLPPLHASRRRQQVKKLQLKCSTSQETASSSSSTNNSPLKPTASEHLRTQKLAIHRASSFPLVNDSTDGKAYNVTSKPKRLVVNKSPYLQPLVHKSYYHKPTPKVQRRKRVKQQLNATGTSEDKQNTTIDSAVEDTTANASSLVPSITLRAATPSSNSDDMSMCLANQVTARKQLAAELDKLNREIQDIVVSVEQVE